MTALEWIQEYEKYLALVKNRANNTVRSYVRDVELLYRFVTTSKLGQPRVRSELQASAFDWAEFTEEKAVDWLRALKASNAKDSNVARKVYSLRQFFKFLRRKKVTTA